VTTHVKERVGRLRDRPRLARRDPEPPGRHPLAVGGQVVNRSLDGPGALVGERQRYVVLLTPCPSCGGAVIVAPSSAADSWRAAARSAPNSSAARRWARAACSSAAFGLPFWLGFVVPGAAFVTASRLRAARPQARSAGLAHRIPQVDGERPLDRLNVPAQAGEDGALGGGPDVGAGRAPVGGGEDGAAALGDDVEERLPAAGVGACGLVCMEMCA
jgi:hypothetical protein